jgi:hypothetical protein
MEFTGTLNKAISMNHQTFITFESDVNIVDMLGKYKGKKLLVEFKQYREKRSYDANAYLWVLLQKIAEVVKSDKWSVYLLMLKRYGQFTYIVVKPSAIEGIKKQWRECEEIGEIDINGTKAIQMLCYYGSSTYDTLQMNKLIDGVVSECHDLEIETLPPDEIRQIKERWGI